MASIPPVFGTVTISAPIDNDILLTTFRATGTFTTDLPVVTYFPDMNNQTKSTSPALSAVGTTLDLGNGVWRSDFTNVEASNGAAGMITAIDREGGGDRVGNLTVQ